MNRNKVEAEPKPKQITRQVPSSSGSGSSDSSISDSSSSDEDTVTVSEPEDNAPAGQFRGSSDSQVMQEFRNAGLTDEAKSDLEPPKKRRKLNEEETGT